MRQALVIGGAGVVDGGDGALEALALERCEASAPRTAVISAAAGEREDDHLHVACQALAALGADPVALALNANARPDLSAVAGCDAVYLTGGATATLLDALRARALMGPLMDAYRRGVLLFGVSAGACWMFERCITTSFGAPAPLYDGAGLLAGAMCPHHSSSPQRRLALEHAQQHDFGICLAVDDGAAVWFCDELVAATFSRRRGAGARLIGAGLVAGHTACCELERVQTGRRPGVSRAFADPQRV